MSNTTKSPKNFEALAAKPATELHKEFAEWLFIKTGVKVDLKTVQLAVSFRMDFQASPENQASLADRKAKAAADKKASASRKAAKLEAKLAEVKAEAKPEPIDPVKMTIVYTGMGEPQVHKFGCADLKKMTRKTGASKETVTFHSHTELTSHIYADMIEGGESTLEENYGGYDCKPCVGKLDS